MCYKTNTCTVLAELRLPHSHLWEWPHLISCLPGVVYILAIISAITCSLPSERFWFLERHLPSCAGSRISHINYTKAVLWHDSTISCASVSIHCVIASTTQTVLKMFFSSSSGLYLNLHLLCFFCVNLPLATHWFGVINSSEWQLVMKNLSMAVVVYAFDLIHRSPTRGILHPWKRVSFLRNAR